MSKTLQIVELMLAEMKKQPWRYQLEITAKGICIIDFIKIIEKTNVMPDYYTFFYQPIEKYEIECNKMFEEFIGGLKA